jgi:cytochrome c biogenesis protein CcmG, thiol:disulfide interchange protein DsbE
VAVSVLVPAVVLAVILVRDGRRGGASSTSMMTVMSPRDPSKVQLGQPVPDFVLPTLDGTTLRLSQLQGRPVVLTFFASWCHDCEEELPVLRAAQHAHPELAVVAVNFQDLASDSRDFAKQLKLDFPVLVEDDSKNPVGTRYGVRGIPLTFFVDKQGVLAHEPLYGPSGRKALQPGLDAILG